MMKKVSIITPCYNGESFVSRYLDTILNQSYNNLELILVNDGSTDQTEAIVMSYKPKFKEVGIEFIYMYQEHAGQAAALNQGLKIFTGDYLTWPDSDYQLIVLRRR
jgi:glycosyltransferase involved in cell wall biosynthesis